MRIDKFLSHSGYGSRKEVKNLIKNKIVTINDAVVTDCKMQVRPEDVVKVHGDIVTYQEFYYYMLNKPQGVITATEDNFQETVMDLFLEQDYRSDLSPVGRLDKDTEGLLLITNDGQLNHRLLSPRHHVDKEYFAEITGIVTEKDQLLFAEGLTLASGELCQPAELKILEVDEVQGTSKIKLVIVEGKFHQVKRMFQAVEKEVTYLKRLRMSDLILDEDLQLGEYRELTDEEIKLLK